MKLDFDCIVIGAGVSGMTSAIYLKRSGINVAILEAKYIGGQINKTWTIKNYPGFKEIDGPTLANSIHEQLKELEVPIIYEEVLDLSISNELKIVKSNKKEYACKAVIIATGRKERHLGLEKEQELIGRGISWCATCDGNFFKEKNVAVVGGGNTAMEDALYLSNICEKVYMINRSDKFRADEILVNQVLNKKNIELMMNSVVKTLITDNDKLQGVILNNKKEIDIEGLFIAIGNEPNIGFIKNLKLDLDKNYIIVNSSMETSMQGVYACGDVIKKNLYQIVTATSEGAIAADSVKKYLELN